MKKSINVKDFIQMMPAVSSQLSESRNAHSRCDDESQASNNFLSTIKNKIKKRKNNNQEVLNHTLFVRKETIP